MTDTSGTEHHTSFVDGAIARLLAFVVAVLIGWFLWSTWSADFGDLMAGDAGKTASVVSASEPAKPANPALTDCLTQRVGDVDRMKEEGILSDAQYGSFRARAEGLCRAQNPG